jgi:4-amino-4-deoxy-L-arabinose transferase-like glycosyltransferase
MAETIERARVCPVATPSRLSLPDTRTIATALLLLVLWLGWSLRLVSWGGNPLHPDEALYAYWARLAASGRDPALLSVPVDKPPLFIYITAFAFRLWGPTVIAARLTGVLASLLSLPILFALTRALYGRSVAFLASLLYAVSPFAVSFAPTAFTDPLLILWGLAACLLAIRGRWGWAGLFLGLAVATKQQGLLVVPLVWGLGRVASAPSPKGSGKDRGKIYAALRLLMGFLPLFAVLVWWDSLRWRVWPSFWERSWIAYGGLRLTVPTEWGERAEDWGGWLGYLVASPWLAGALLLSIVLLLGAAWASRRRLDVAARADLVVLGYGGGFLLLHGVLSFQPWDRYLLPLVPLTALLLARGLLFPLELEWLHGSFRRLYLSVLCLLLLAALPGPARSAALSQLPVGGDHGAYIGLEQAVAWARAELPADAVLYHQDLGWHLAYYLFDKGPQARWYADASALAEDVGRHDHPSYVMLSRRTSADDVEATFASHGMRMILKYGVFVNGQTTFALYEIVRGMKP